MAKDPAVLFYTSDFMSGCLDLDMTERGQYITLLCAQHQKGALSEKTIRLLVGSVSFSVLSKFKQDADGNFYNERMREEAEKRAQFVDSRHNNGKKGGRPQKHKDNHMVLHMGNHMENENENENINDNGLRKRGAGEKPLRADVYPTFDDFWEAYQKKRGRELCLKKWEKLPQAERERCMASLPAYIASTPDPQFRKDPATYLNQKAYNDEIITSNGAKAAKTHDSTNRKLEALVSGRIFSVDQPG